MKLKVRSFLAATAAAVTLLSSCGGNSSEGKSLSELENSSATDSLLYYFGQMRASEYWRESKRDTTLASQESRQAFLAGMQAGFNSVKEDNEAYNVGVQSGIQLAVSLSQFSKEYGVKVDPKVIMESIAYGLRTDSIDESEVSQQFYDLMGKLNDRKEAADRKASAEALKETGEKLKMRQISAVLYAKTIKEGSGPAVVENDKVNVDITMTDVNGKKVDVPMPPELTVGARFTVPLITTALKTMKVGGTSQFATTAGEMFGRRATQMDMKATDVLLIRIDVKSLAADKPAAPADTLKSK